MAEINWQSDTIYAIVLLLVVGMCCRLLAETIVNTFLTQFLSSLLSLIMPFVVSVILGSIVKRFFKGYQKDVQSTVWDLLLCITIVIIFGILLKDVIGPYYYLAIAGAVIGLIIQWKGGAMAICRWIAFRLNRRFGKGTVRKTIVILIIIIAVIVALSYAFDRILR